MTSHQIRLSGLTARINEHGAELCSLRDMAGREYIWQAGEAWKRHAPNLFPIVGRLQNDTFRHNGEYYKMTQHGFARDRAFAWESRGESSCGLFLQDDRQSRAQYPFSFRFGVDYELAGSGLTISYSVENTGDEVLPASIGAHPAFNWPIIPGISKADHRLEFSHPEMNPLRQVKNGLLTNESSRSPVQGSLLNLNESLFANDSLILDKPASSSVTYSAPGSPGLRVSWDAGFRELGIWSKPGADFICIEPWRGMASPEGFDGELTEKPGIMLIAPGDNRKASYKIEILS